MALNFPDSPSTGDEFVGGGFTWTWTGTTWSKVAASTAGAANDFALLVGATGNTTYVLDRTYTSGRYTIDFINNDTSYDIYAIAEDGSYAGYTSGATLEVSANFGKIVIIGAAVAETVLFSYQGVLTSPTATGDIATGGAFISSVVTSSLPSVDDTTVVNGGNFAANVAVSFIDQSAVETSAKTVVRSSSTQLIITRPDAFSPDDSPYTVKVVNPGVPVPAGTNSHLLSNSVTAGTNPVWTTATTVVYNVGGATSVTLLATDTEATDIDYSVVSGTLPAGLALDGETGAITGTASGTPAEGDVTVVTIRAIDTGGNFLDKAFDFTANVAPTWTTATGELDPTPEPDSAYSFQLVASTGSAGGALTYTLQSGSLLAGHSLSTAGVISGTSTGVADDTATFTVRVTDEGGLFADRSFTTTITAIANFLMLAHGGNATSNTLLRKSLPTPDGGLVHVGYSNGLPGVSNYQLFVVKTDAAGASVWQKSFDATSTANTDQSESAAIDSSGNIYICGRTYSGSEYRALVIKLNSSGVIQWQRTLHIAGDSSTLFDVTLDSSNNVIAVGSTQSELDGNPVGVLIAKWNSSGTLQWRRYLSGGGSDYGRGVAVDSNDNIYVGGNVGGATAGAGNEDAFLAKYNSSGAIQWQRVLGGAVSEYFYSIAVDSNDDIICRGQTSSVVSGKTLLLIAKYNSSGALQFQKTLQSSSGATIHNLYTYGTALAVDSSDNFYVAASLSGGTYIGTSNDGFIVKYNSSGIVQWSKLLGVEANDTIQGFAIDNNDSLLVAGKAYFTGWNFLFAKLPTDGTISGAFTVGSNIVQYLDNPSTLTEASSSLTAATSSITENVSTTIDSTSALSSANQTATLNVTGGTPSIAWLTAASLPAITKGGASSKILVAATEGFESSVTFALTTGTLPAGITLSGAVLSGTSTEAAGTVKTFTITATSSSGSTAAREFTLATVMAPRFSSSSVDMSIVNFAPYTDQYYVFYGPGSATVTSLTNSNNCIKMMVGGGASGAMGTGVGGDGANVHNSDSHSFTTNEAHTLTNGAGGNYSFNNSNNNGTSTSFDGDSAGGGVGTGGNGANGSTNGSTIMQAIYAHLPYWNQPNQDPYYLVYRGIQSGYLGGGGSNISSGSVNLPGVGGGGRGIYNAGGAQAGLHLSGGGGGGGGTTSYGSAAGPNGGQGMMIIKVPNQT